jgi:hypothetical protein
LLVTITSLSSYANLVTNLEGEAKVNNGYLSYTFSWVRVRVSVRVRVRVGVRVSI